MNKASNYFNIKCYIYSSDMVKDIHFYCGCSLAWCWPTGVLLHFWSQCLEHYSEFYLT